MLRVKSSIYLFLSGLDEVGGLLCHYIKPNPNAFLPLFCEKSEPLTVQQFKSLYAIKWSDAGSNRRESEENTILWWEQFLLQVNWLG